MWKTAFVSVLVLVGSARADDDPWKLGPAEVSDVGVYKSVPTPIDRDVEVTDHPIVFTLHPLWQEDQKYSAMFENHDPNGKSEICGPTSGTILLQYLKTEHKPAFPNLFKDRKDNESSVKHMFELMDTNRSTGTGTSGVDKGLRKEVELSGYKVSKFSFVMGGDAGMKKNQVAPTLAVLRETHGNGNPAILHVGWYDLKKKGDKWEAERQGGHFVVLAGYDRDKPNTFYVTNPIFNYKNPDKRWYSKIEFEEVDLTAKMLKNDGAHPLRPHMLMSRDLGKHHMAILEDIVVVVPDKP